VHFFKATKLYPVGTDLQYARDHCSDGGKDNIVIGNLERDEESNDWKIIEQKFHLLLCEHPVGVAPLFQLNVNITLLCPSQYAPDYQIMLTVGE